MDESINLKVICWKDKQFVFVYNRTFESFIELFDKIKDFVLQRIEDEFGELLFDQVYIILDDWGISRATLPTKNCKHALILLNTVNHSTEEIRDNKTLMFYTIHELCHLTKKGNFPFGKTPPEVHKRFDELAEEIVRKLFKININKI
jgi:hypothetical protein